MTAFSTTSSLPDGLVRMFEKSRVALTVADALQPDCPLIGMNRAFADLSGYTAEEVLDRNCRFMQPPGGAGPVRARIRHFLASPDQGSDRFVLPNQRKDGSDFLNLVFMTKLAGAGGQQLVLGSQFAIVPGRDAAERVYTLALESDLRHMKEVLGDQNWMMLGTLEALASSHAIIAKARMDEGWGP